MPNKAFRITERLSAHAEEAYKVLRSNIQFCELGGEIRTLTIISCKPGEGKSTTSVNLGASMAGTGKRVIVVDADLRKPMLMKHMGNTDFHGISNYISGRVSLDEIIHSTNVEGMYFVASGVKPPNPAELIGSARFGELLKILRSQYDVVIIDTPPLGNVIDGALIAAQTDGTIMVIQYNTVDYQTACRVKEQLEKANARILGVVLNKVQEKAYRGSYHYYGYYSQWRDPDRELFHRLSKTQGAGRQQEVKQ